MDEITRACRVMMTSARTTACFQRLEEREAAVSRSGAKSYNQTTNNIMTSGSTIA